MQLRDERLSRSSKQLGNPPFPVGPITVVVLLLLLSAGLVAADIGTAERNVESSQAEPGEIVTIEISVQVDNAGERMSIEEFFEWSFESATLLEVSHNGVETIPLISFADEEDGVLIALEPSGGFTAGDTVSVVYAVTIQEEANGDATYRVNGESTLDDNEPIEHTGNAIIAVSGPDDEGSGVSDSVTDDFEDNDAEVDDGSDGSDESPPVATTTEEPTSDVEEETYPDTDRSGDTDRKATPTEASADRDSTPSPTPAESEEVTVEDGAGMGPLVALLALLSGIGIYLGKR